MRLAIALLMGFAGQSAGADKEREKMLKAPLDAMENAIRTSDETLFKAQWHVEGYAKNLVGSAGLSGEDVFKQGSPKKWFLKPDLTQAQVLGDGAAVIVPCAVWAWEKDKSVDKVRIVLVKTEVKIVDKTKTVYLVLGGGEKPAPVEALANRFLRKEALEPPKEVEK